MQTRKQYVITDKGVYLAKDLRGFCSIGEALFFDNEESAYLFFTKNVGFISDGIKDRFYKIECVLIAFKEKDV
jgi:hypothetical protein